MGCTPSMLLDHKKGHRDSTESQDQVLGGKGNKDGGSRGNNGRSNEPNVAKTAPRASMDSDGFSIQLGPTQAPNSASSTNNKKDSYVSQMGNNYTTSLHIKRISALLRILRPHPTDTPWIIYEPKIKELASQIPMARYQLHSEMIK